MSAVGQDHDMSEVWIRGAVGDDAESVRAIYAPIVEATHISFELTPPPEREMRGRIESVTSKLPWLVAVEDDQILGYSYAVPHGERAAYQWAVDTSVYLAEEARGRGIGMLLYTNLLDRLRGLGYVSAFAGVALPNPASVALHQRVGFVRIGSFPLAGFKLGRWVDVSLWRCALNDPPAMPSTPLMWRHS